MSVNGTTRASSEEDDYLFVHRLSFSIRKDSYRYENTAVLSSSLFILCWFWSVYQCTCYLGCKALCVLWGIWSLVTHFNFWYSKQPSSHSFFSARSNCWNIPFTWLEELFKQMECVFRYSSYFTGNILDSHVVIAYMCLVQSLKKQQWQNLLREYEIERTMKWTS